MNFNDINQKFTARLKGITAFIRALALNRTLKLCMCCGSAAATDGKRVYLPYSVIFGDFDRRYALGMAAHEVGHCLYTDFNSLDLSQKSYATLSDLFRLGCHCKFSMPLRKEDGSVGAYWLQSEFMRRETYRVRDSKRNEYRKAIVLWRDILNALEDARIERRFKADRPETGYVINAVYTKALREVQIKNLPYKSARYVFGVCCAAAAVISRSVKPGAVDIFCDVFSADPKEKETLERARTLITEAAAYAESTGSSFMAPTSTTEDVFALTAALLDLFYFSIESDEKDEEKKSEDKKQRKRKDAESRDEAELFGNFPRNVQDLLRDKFQSELSDEVADFIQSGGLGDQEITIESKGAGKSSKCRSLLPLEEITEARNAAEIPVCGDQNMICRSLNQILYPPQSRVLAVGLRRRGVSLNERKLAYAANRCVSEPLFKAKTLTLSNGMTQLAVIVDTSSSTKGYRDDYLRCFELLRKVLGKADGSRLLSSIYCFCSEGVGRIKRVNEKFDRTIASRLCYTGFTPGFAALYYAMTELAASRAKRKLILCLTDGEFTDTPEICSTFMGNDGVGIKEAGIKLACIYVKTRASVFPDDFKPHYSQMIESAEELPRAILRAVRAIY